MKDIRHVGICVDDLEDADLFYRQLLGLKFLDSKTETDEYIRSLLGIKCLTWVKLQADNGDILELYWLPQDNKASFNHVAFTVEDIHTLETKLLRYGIRCSTIKTDKEKKHLVMFVRDFDQNLVELVENIHEPKPKESTHNKFNNSKKREERQADN